MISLPIFVPLIAGNDERGAQLAVCEFYALLDQMDKLGCGPNVIGRRLHRDQDEVRGLDRRYGEVGRLRRSVDHDQIYARDVL